jgi:DNA-binding NtrC family response regulator
MKSKETVFLIVDDEPDMCWALEHILETNGVRAKRALTAQEALTLLESERFPLVFLDAKLPDMEGLELARRIREMNPSVRIVMVSGYFYREDEAVQKALTEGLICGFIAKPFLHDEIRRVVETVRGSPPSSLT